MEKRLTGHAYFIKFFSSQEENITNKKVTIENTKHHQSDQICSSWIQYERVFTIMALHIKHSDFPANNFPSQIKLSHTFGILFVKEKLRGRHIFFEFFDAINFCQKSKFFTQYTIKKAIDSQQRFRVLVYRYKKKKWNPNDMMVNLNSNKFLK